MIIFKLNNRIKNPQYPDARTAPHAPPLYPHGQEHHHGHQQQEDVMYRTMPPKDAFKDELKNKFRK